MSKGSLVSKISKSIGSLESKEERKQVSNHSKEFIEEVKAAGIKNSLLMSKQNNVPKQEGKFHILSKRFAKMEKWIRAMRDPVDGIKFVDHKKFFDVIPHAATGAEVTDWIVKYLKPEHRYEARQLFQLMLEHGFMVPLDSTHAITISDDVDTYYTYQLDYFFMSRWIECSDIDYASYLVRKSERKKLSPKQEKIMAEFSSTMGLTWKVVNEQVERQKAYIGGMDKRDRKLFEAREASFWRVHKPLGDLPMIMQVHEEDKKYEKKRLSEEAAYSKLPESKVLEIALNKVKQLELYRVPSSAACRNLIKSCDNWLDLDPLISRTDNPWLGDTWPSDENDDSPPASQRVALWRASFTECLSDPKGRKLFAKWLEKDLAGENLSFYMDCESLHTVFDRAEFYRKAVEISKEYIQPESNHEINIDAQLRNSILDKLQNSSAQDLDVNIFSLAVEHVYEMMRKDVFPRFMGSDEIKGYLGDYQNRVFKTYTAAPETKTVRKKKSASMTSEDMLEFEREKIERMKLAQQQDRYVARTNTIRQAFTK